MNLIFNPRFNDLDCWDNTKVLIVFKEELSAREKKFSPESDNTKYTASSLLTAYDKVKRTDVSCLFCTKYHKTQSCKVVGYTCRNQKKILLKIKGVVSFV